MNSEDLISLIETSLNRHDYIKVRGMLQRIDPKTYSIKQVKQILSLLRRKRDFDNLDIAAQKFIEGGHNSPVLYRQRAQALIDRNLLSQALSVLKSIEQEVSQDTIEGPEIRGLIGRSYKQLYVNEGNPDNLVKAINAYMPDCNARKEGWRWHAVNVVALLHLAEQEGVYVDKDLSAEGAAAQKQITNTDYKALARDIIADIEDRDASAIWDYATAMEASIALEDVNAVLSWAKKYVKHPDADSFEFSSTMRQLREVWKLENTDLGNKLLPVLEYALSQEEGASFEPLSTPLSDASGFEAVYGQEGVTFMVWLDNLHKKCLAIARISDSATGQIFGTGFLIKGSELEKDWGDQLVLVTNSHVCSNDPNDGAPLKPENAMAEFTRLEGRPKVSLGELIFTSPKTALDVSVLRIQPPNESGYLELLFNPPVKPQPGDPPQRIYVVGHPNGSELAISMYDNDLDDYSPPFVRYRSPTEPGNSGSPVFNRQWAVFALHHKAIQDLKLNEGVLFNSIQEALRE